MHLHLPDICIGLLHLGWSALILMFVGQLLTTIHFIIVFNKNTPEHIELSHHLDRS